MAGRCRFACHVRTDSMYDLILPDDLLVFQAQDVPKLGAVVLWRTFDSRVAVKTLKHNGENYYLHSENPRYEDCLADGQQIGFLVGIIREIGSLRTTSFDATGFRP
jgi:SOS-response transcriptional repressor LexA